MILFSASTKVDVTTGWVKRVISYAKSLIVFAGLGPTLERVGRVEASPRKHRKTYRLQLLITFDQCPIRGNIGRVAVSIENIYVIDRDWREHDRLLMDFDSNHLEVPFMHVNGGGLWDEIRSYKQRWVVDNNTPFERLAGSPEFSDTAFIVGTTVLNERAQPILFFEKLSDERKAFVNVFYFSVPWLHGEYRLAIDRADRAYFSLHNRDKVVADAGFKNPRDESAESLNDLRLINWRCILWMAYRRAGLSLGPSLAESVRGLAPRCPKNYRLSAKVATLCFARLLVASERGRNNFNENGSMNGFMDAALIKDALFFNAGILSGDRDVRRMAHFCGIKTKARLDKNPPMKKGSKPPAATC